MKTLIKSNRTGKKLRPPIEFIWGLPIPQLEWVHAGDTKRKPGRYLTNRRVGRPEWREAYRPFDQPARDARHTGLFRTFTETQPTEEGVLSFAHRYGCLLGGDGPGIYVTGELNMEVISHGETLEFWRSQILGMKAAVLLWDLATAGSEEATELIRASGILEEISNSPIGLILSQRLRLEEEDTNIAALNFLASYVNQQLRNEKSRTDVRRQLHSFGAPPTLKLVDRPTNLLSALWLQFALAIDGGKDFVKCSFCNSWFEVSPFRRGQRPESHYCRPSCRVNAYRERIAKAQELHRQHEPYPEIAKKLGTSVQQIKKWVTATHGPGKSLPRRVARSGA